MASDGWESTTWEGARRAQLRDQARLDPAERLRWLEEALELAAQATPQGGVEQRSSRADEDPGSDDG